jgi:hypothetical protein
MPSPQRHFQNNNVTFDPQIVGFDTSFWKTLSGSDPSISSNKVRINNREIVSYSFYAQQGSYEYTLNVPTVPTASDVRSWGLKCPSLDNRGRIEFDVTDTVFSAKVFDDTGNALLNSPIAWSSAWTATDTRFRIDVTEFGIDFFVNEIKLSSLESSNLPTLPVSLHIKNGLADNLDFTVLAIRRSTSLS